MTKASVVNPFVGFTGNRKEFLQSGAYNKMLNRLVSGLTGRSDLTVKLLTPDDEDLGYTDGKTICINPCHKDFEGETIENITVYCLALILHESLHPVYSDFYCIEEANRFHSGDKSSEAQVRGTLLNILEDARIERIGAYEFPGIAYSLNALRLLLYKQRKNIPDTDPLNQLMEYIWQYATVGLTKQPLSDGTSAFWEKIKPLAKKARMADICSECYDCTLEIMKYIRVLIMDMPNFDSKEYTSGSGKNNGNKGKPVNANTNGDDFQSELRNDDADEDQNGNSGKGNPDTSSDENTSSQGQSENNKKEDKDQKTNSGSSENKGSDKETNDEQNKAGQSDAHDDANSGEQPSNHLFENSDDLQKLIQDALNKTIDEFKQEKTMNQDDKKAFQKDSCSNLQELSTSMISCSYQNFEDYNLLKQQVIPIIKNLKRKLLDILNFNQDEMQRYLSSGGIDSKSLSRILTGNVCAKRIEKSEESNLNIVLLLDQSSSMYSENRYINTMLACVVFEEVCKDLKIPLSVLGFGNCTLYHYMDYRQKNKNALYSVAQYCPSGGTPLGEAVKYVDSYLHSIREEDKIVIIITDGRPNNDTLAINNIIALRKKALVYGLAIGEGRDVLKRIFNEDYISIDNLKKLPNSLCKILEKHILKK